jgi:hypothetical protein
MCRETTASGQLHRQPETYRKCRNIINKLKSLIKVKVKVKQSHYRPGQSLRVSGG